MNWFTAFFDNSSFMPHGHCYLWQQDILAMHVGSDVLIGISYYSIPLALIYFTRQRTDVTFNWVFYMFSAFIFACGTTHLFDVWTTWNPAYRTEGVIKVITALISAATAIAVWPLVPRALAWPSVEQLRDVNDRLEDEAQQRESLQESLRTLRSREILAEDRERRKLGSELHDGLGQILTLANMRLGAVGAGGDAQLAGSVRGIQDLIKTAQEQIRTLSFELSPPVLHDVGINAAIDWLAEDLETRFSLRTEVDAEPIPAIESEATRLTVFRAVRELLTNTAKHAGVERARLRLWMEADHIHGEVMDEGTGFDPVARAKGYGLFSLREEITESGGTIEINSSPVAGTQIQFSLPILA